MKPLTIAAACLAVFFLALSMLVSAPAPAPAAQVDRCLMCHPKAHPNGWTQQMHITDIKDGAVTVSECTQCHTVQYCVDCHAKYQGSGSSSSTSAQPATAP